MEYKNNSIAGDEEWISQQEYENGNVPVSGNDTYKLNTNFKLNEGKLFIIKRLNSYTFKTPVFKIANDLKELFKECQSRPYHWARISEHYPPRAINRVLAYMIKYHGNWENLENAGAYFTELIKYRKKRKKFRKYQ